MLSTFGTESRFHFDRFEDLSGRPAVNHGHELLLPKKLDTGRQHEVKIAGLLSRF
jgi:hypothetical protein